MIRIFFIVTHFFIITVLAVPPVPAAGEGDLTARQKAAEIHRIASSDVIYQDQAVQALYYQNLEIIGLLEDIRGLMRDLVAAAREDERE